MLGTTVLGANSGGWLGQKPVQMNRAPFSTHHDFDATEQCNVAHMDDVMTSAFRSAFAFNCIIGPLSEAI
jgi:hypothetical protein